jgi:hypothetical protein
MDSPFTRTGITNEWAIPLLHLYAFMDCSWTLPVVFTYVNVDDHCLKNNLHNGLFKTTIFWDVVPLQFYMVS